MQFLSRVRGNAPTAHSLSSVQTPVATRRPALRSAWLAWLVATMIAAPAGIAAPPSGALQFADADSDGIADLADNCLLASNAPQRDTDSDLYGNLCDADFNNDGVVNFADLGLLKQDFFASGDLDTDLNDDGSVNFLDLALVKSNFFGVPGPSGAAAAAASVRLTRVFPALAFEAPVGLYQAPHTGSHWYVIGQGGIVHRFVNAQGTATAEQFISIADRIQTDREAGLLGMAFHPDYANNGYAYLSYTAPGITTALISRISRFETTDGGLTLDADSEVVLLSVEQRFLNHNGGHIVFGPDGYLYIGFGDGSGSGANSQDLNTLLGALLRVDVDVSQADFDQGVRYYIPPDNPYAANTSCEATTGCPELYAWGLRNPWRFNFDSGTGELWLGDVGQDSFEEINRVTLGGNYGWRCYEGFVPFNTDDCLAFEAYDAPVHVYSHDIGQSVTGGYVYRGAAMPALRGVYVYGDFRTGRIFGQLGDSPLPGELLDADIRISSFAQDATGELFVLDYLDGGIYRIEP